MRRCLLLLLLAALPLIPLHTPPPAAAAQPPPAPPAATTASADPVPLIRSAQPLHGLVLAWEDGRIQRLAGAHVGTGQHTVRTDANGRFTIPADIRTDQLTVVAPGYHIVRRHTTVDYTVVFTRPLEVRAVYLPFDLLRRQEVLDWALDLARRGTVTALVIDIKDEGGSVLSLVANRTAHAIDAADDPGTEIEAFLSELSRLGIYRIARVVAFLDGRLALGLPETALRTNQGAIFRSANGWAWTDPSSELARRYNIEIGVNAARYFEEIQYDYVRLPTEPSVALRAQTSGAERSALITTFAREAAQSLHAAGAALAFDTFGQTTIILHDDGIGQILEDLAPFLDYYSPMVYPSTWTPGWFGLAYPPADPFRVVADSIAAAVNRLRPFPNVVVRPWLQDFHDYQEEKLFYGPDQVLDQIRAVEQAGGSGFMLWDPSLNYQTALLAGLAAAAR